MKKIALIILAGLMSAASGLACTTAVISAGASESGRPMLWKQRDTSTGANYVAYFCSAGYAFMAVVSEQDPLCNSVWSGANEVGFAIMNSQSYGLSPIRDVPRPNEGIVMKRALEICRTVDDFQHLLDTLARPNGLEANFGVIDAMGGAAYFEAHDLGYERFDVPENGFLVRSNLSVNSRPGEGHGYDRQELTERLMNEKGSGFTPQWMADVLGRNELMSRATTVNSQIIEGVNVMDAPNSSVLWTAVGYTQCSYLIPVWVAAGQTLPAALNTVRPDGTVVSPASDLAIGCRARMREDESYKERLLSLTRTAEDNELRFASKVNARVQRILARKCRNERVSARRQARAARIVSRYNKAADRRFNGFAAEIASVA